MSHHFSNTTPILEVTGLTKCFGETVILRGVDLSVERGTVLGVLGREDNDNKLLDNAAGAG